MRYEEEGRKLVREAGARAREMGQHRRIGAEGESLRRNMEGQPSG